MKFTDFKYERPSLEEYKQQIAELIAVFTDDSKLEDEVAAIKQSFAIEDTLDTMMGIAGVRHTIDTKDDFYNAEKDFADQNGPLFQEQSQALLMKIFNSRHRAGLVKEFGELLFTQVELQLKTFKPEIIEELQLENKLSSEYSVLIASAEIEFNGETYNLSGMGKFTTDKDRDTRHKAQLAVSNWFESQETKIDELYDGLVKVRHAIAKKLGYSDFTQLGYDRLGRSDYNAEDVKRYREQIFESVVPLAKELTERKSKRIEIADMKSYDLALSFLTGNPKPKGDSTWQLNHAKDMYSEMSPETKSFIEMMTEMELLDLDTKPGKQGGGYCTYFPDYNAPFIFANFNGTSGDVDVLTHEAGHAFQVYLSKELIPSYRWPTLEAAEIASMSMEFLAWPWINKFFIEDTEKYKFSHLAGAITFLPYGVAVDEFQHEVYAKPEMTPEQRKDAWRKIEKKYLPYKDYDDDKFLERGGFWFRQGHIFGAPFYYIDYTLAQIVAFQYWIKAQDNHEQALEEYMKICKLGGSKSFVNLLKSAGLRVPFDQGVVSRIITPIKGYLDSVDDSKL
jgi:M3 family oligoendopeptidase